jgi:hypothetical protein
MSNYSGGIFECTYCGERYGSKAMYCKTCRTTAGRKAIFEANVEIAKENKAKGFTVPETFRDYRPLKTIEAERRQKQDEERKKENEVRSVQPSDGVSETSKPVE